MATTFTKNKRTGKFDVIGLKEEVAIGDVVVTRKDGTESVVWVYSVSRSFTGKYGENKGQDCVIGRIGRREYAAN